MQRATPEAAKRVAVLLLCAALSGCGLKGSLYLPPEPLEPSAPAVDEANGGTTSPSATPATGAVDSGAASALPEEPETGIEATTRPTEPELEEQTDGRNEPGATAAEDSGQ